MKEEQTYSNANEVIRNFCNSKISQVDSISWLFPSNPRDDSILFDFVIDPPSYDVILFSLNLAK